jgi:hypothetical protein
VLPRRGAAGEERELGEQQPHVELGEHVEPSRLPPSAACEHADGRRERGVKRTTWRRDDGPRTRSRWCYTGTLSNGRLTEQMTEQMTEQKLLDFSEPTDPD